MSGSDTKWQVHIYSRGLHTPIAKTPPAEMTGYVFEWVSHWMSLWPAEQIHRATKKLQTYKIISHQKLGFVILGCDAVFLHHGLYVFIHVHPLGRLLYLSLALEVAEVWLSYNIRQGI